MNTENISSAKLAGYAHTAYRDFIGIFYKATESGGYFIDPYKDGHGRDTFSDIMWVYAQGLLALETYYTCCGCEEIKSIIGNQFKTWYDHYDREWMLSTGCNNNPALDDAAWSSMAMMLGYKILGDKKYLTDCHDMIERAYDYWQDGDCSNGLWYSYPQDKNSQVKSIYCVGLLLSSIEYHRLTVGTKDEDTALFERTLDVYHWVENNLARRGSHIWNGKEYCIDDDLYFCSFTDNESARCPVSCDNPSRIIATKSCSALFGNTGMAVIHKRLYDMTKDPSYLEKAVRTANALVKTQYNANGIILNDRDAWTNSAFIGYFTREVLCLEGIDPELSVMLKNTAESIVNNCRTEEGFYGADWSCGDEWKNREHFGDCRYFSLNATSIHIIFAAYCHAASGK